MEIIVGNLEVIKQEWEPICTEDMFQIPTERPVICMEHKRTKEHAYYDVKLDRLLSPQEAYDVLRGYYWAA